MFNIRKLTVPIVMLVTMVQVISSTQAFALGVEELAGKHVPGMVTNDMLLNADKIQIIGYTTIVIMKEHVTLL